MNQSGNVDFSRNSLFLHPTPLKLVGKLYLKKKVAFYTRGLQFKQAGPFSSPSL